MSQTGVRMKCWHLMEITFGMSFLTEETFFNVNCLTLAKRFLTRLICVMFPLYVLLCFCQLRIVKFQITRFVPRCTMVSWFLSLSSFPNYTSVGRASMSGTVRHLSEIKCSQLYRYHLLQDCAPGISLIQMFLAGKWCNDSSLVPLYCSQGTQLTCWKLVYETEELGHQ